MIAVLEVEVIGGFLTKFARSITLAQNIEVLAVEQALENAGSLSAGGGLNDGTAGEATAGGTEQPPAQPAATVVTLALTPLQTQHLFLAEDQGVIRLVVRPAGDDEIQELPESAFFAIADSTYPLGLITDAVQIGG